LLDVQVEVDFLGDTYVRFYARGDGSVPCQVLKAIRKTWTKTKANGTERVNGGNVKVLRAQLIVEYSSPRPNRGFPFAADPP